ncbi:MAG: hypothetical protein D6761_09355 [Candidatus Dadabacteria bacterium]|nr:MAG: hypothetical protein D6761_09355 [Candidatus Dadabacteria bacterium]
MRRATLPLLFALLLAPLACQRAPESYDYAPALTASAAERQMTIERWSAEPVAIQSTTVLVARELDEAETCARCHDGKGTGRKPDGAGHDDIAIEHAAGMECSDCHERNRPQLLTTLDGNVPLHDQAARCRECHRNQVGDWLGGSHGKRLSGWAETRVVANCAHCHNPHSPSLKPRMPVATPVIVPERLGPMESNHVEH